MTLSSQAGDILKELAQAFNSKDAMAFSELFSADAEFVNVRGARMRGREAIAVGHARSFATTLAGSQLSWTAVDTMPLSDDVTICHAHWTRKRRADAKGPVLHVTGIFTLVLHRHGDTWEIAAATNVEEVAAPEPPTSP
jgi:uncharacterized protein (TIGR02246 family)